MAAYNITRAVTELLDEHKDSLPSFTIQLYPEHWTLNGGPKFLYNNQVASLLDDVRAQRIPTDFLELFDSAGLPFYDGSMIVELLDYRPPKGKDPLLDEPVASHVVLSPHSESLWQDICLLNHKFGASWTDRETLEIESKILMATAPPLCLDPDPRLTRVANNILRVSVPATPLSLKRKAAATEQEEEESEKARRIKIMQYMNPRVNRSTAPSYRILDVIDKIRRQRAQLASQSAQNPLPGSTPVAPPRYGPPQPALSSPAPEAPVTNTPTPIPPAAPVPTAIVNSNSIQSRATPTPAAESAPTPPSIVPPAVPAPAPRAANPPQPTPTPTPAVSASTPRPPSIAPPSAIPPHMQPPHIVPTPRISPPVQRPPSAITTNGVASSPVPRPASTVQPQQTPRQVPAGLPRQPQQAAPIAAAPSPQQQYLQPQPSAQPQQQQQTQQQLQGQQGPNYVYSQQANSLMNMRKAQLMAYAQKQRQQAQAQAQAVQNGRAATPVQPQQAGQSPLVQGLRQPQQQQPQNSPRPMNANAQVAAAQARLQAVTAQHVAQQAAARQQQEQQQQQQPQPQQPQQQQYQQQLSQQQSQTHQHSFTYPMNQTQNQMNVAQHSTNGQHLRPVIHNQHAMLAQQFHANNQQQVQQGQGQMQQQQHAQPQNQAQAQAQAQLHAQQMQMMYQYQMQMNMQGMQQRVPQNTYQWPANVMARNVQMAQAQASAAANGQGGKPAGS